ncbi:hypothetical protein BJ508DRAFT_303228 [Ascobolus immersus RN42]|uniref:Uncharacterized protein n=1 Tax=Ascobolus immersus RN42 TaxID=1160509 RepID=A0A3N4IGB8_ASCIM|nr:hypothetical protein BJ508DRAFT_303228 [Ascobolus immersus RN42]
MPQINAGYKSKTDSNRSVKRFEHKQAKAAAKTLAVQQDPLVPPTAPSHEDIAQGSDIGAESILPPADSTGSKRKRKREKQKDRKKLKSEATAEDGSRPAEVFGTDGNRIL